MVDQQIIVTPEDLVSLDFTRKQKAFIGGVEVKWMEAVAPWIDGRFMGIDPGRNFGLTELHDGRIYLFGGKLPKETTQDKYAICAFNMMRWHYQNLEEMDTVIEGSSYKEPFGQTGMAYIRMGFMLGLLSNLYPVRLSPPAAIRKKVFGEGNMMMSNYFPTMDHNVADSLAIALYAAGIKIGEQNGE